MRTARGSKWVTLYSYENKKLVVIHEPLRDYEIHNLLVKGWRLDDASSKKSANITKNRRIAK